jgi:DNA repair and recombination protein RAD52
MKMSLPQEVIDKLEAEFDQARAKIKEVEGRPDALYLESYDVINKANEVFGYGGWGTKVVNIELKEAGGKTICVATLELDVEGCLPRQDVGAVIAAQKREKPLSVDALETAVKGAVSDSLKRCFRHYGKQFGNDLYAKDGDVPKAKSAAKRKPKQTKAAKTEHPSVQYWRYVREKGIDENYAKELLAGLDNAFEQALEELRERSSD